MAKDPAFLFYSSDFLIGTAFFTDEQVGRYTKLLCYQHQTGHLTESNVVEICKGKDEIILKKFKKDDNGLYYNERLEEEALKRKNFCASRGKNRSKHMKNISNSYEKHMENENEDVNDNKNTTKTTKEYLNPEEFSHLKDPDFLFSFADYIEMRIKIRKPATFRAKKMTLKQLQKYELKTAIKMLDQSVEKSWNGVFPLKDYVPPGARKREEPTVYKKPDPKQQEAVSKLIQETKNNIGGIV